MQITSKLLVEIDGEQHPLDETMKAIAGLALAFQQQVSAEEFYRQVRNFCDSKLLAMEQKKEAK